MKRSPILCVDQTGFKTSREGPNTSRNHLNNFALNMDNQFKFRNQGQNKSQKVLKINQQVYSPDFEKRYRDSPEDQFSATFNNQISSVQKQSEAFHTSPCQIAPQFLNDDSSFKDLPRVPKLDLGKLTVDNASKKKDFYI